MVLFALRGLKLWNLRSKVLVNIKKKYYKVQKTIFFKMYVFWIEFCDVIHLFLFSFILHSLWNVASMSCAKNLLIFFNASGRDTARMTRNINDLYGSDAANERTVRFLVCPMSWWKFYSGEWSSRTTRD